MRYIIIIIINIFPYMRLSTIMPGYLLGAKPFPGLD